jgi:hypothetical protein
MESLCGRQMFYVPCGTQHLSRFIICSICQNIIKFMESREMLGQVRVVSMGDVGDPHEVTVWKNWGY